MTYTLIDSTTLTSTAQTVTFTGISATGKGDLVLVAGFSHTGSTGEFVFLQFNGSSTNGTMVGMGGNGSSASKSTATKMHFSTGGTSTTRGTCIVQIQDYSATDKHKAALVRCNISNLKTEAMANRWASTAAITSVSVVGESAAALFAIGSTFHLYQLVSE